MKSNPFHSIPTNQTDPKYFGLFEIIAKVGKVAYTLKLPPKASIHPTFHVSLLKQHFGPAPTFGNNLTEKVFECVIDKRVIKRQNIPVIEWLIQLGTWEKAVEMEKLYPISDPWGQGSSHWEGNDTIMSLEELGLGTIRSLMIIKLLAYVDFPFIRPHVSVALHVHFLFSQSLYLKSIGIIRNNCYYYVRLTTGIWREVMFPYNLCCVQWMACEGDIWGFT
ncbi:LOW QUALITY PROTEIN: hypothetical protein OSB04_013225 [Centaurea solstitialis]|uniref:Tf2-1-like SH3-like domain-containing protein n=1 Tax=Centaurea solstitialis TaxID=347529 RepID=A0AA38TNH6_9ASTR|nr:LOW QUALITY PROTEIN: hypothetical protein OSB04_013225 [Centaurea solstitialis]